MAEIMSELAKRGISLWADGGTLRYCRKTAMPPYLASELKAAKVAVLAALAAKESGALATTPAEIWLWIGCLREAGCRIDMHEGVPTIQWSEGSATTGRLMDWEANISVITAVLDAARDVVAVGHQPELAMPHPSIPPATILAHPIVLCPQCQSRAVLVELRKLTGGLCYPCCEREARQ